MAWKARCPHCREEISSGAKICPHCRTVFTAAERKSNSVRGAVALLAGLGLFAVVLFFTPLGECVTCGKIKTVELSSSEPSKPMAAAAKPPTPEPAIPGPDLSKLIGLLGEPEPVAVKKLGKWTQVDKRGACHVTAQGRTRVDIWYRCKGATYEVAHEAGALSVDVKDSVVTGIDIAIQPPPEWARSRSNVLRLMGLPPSSEGFDCDLGPSTSACMTWDAVRGQSIITRNGRQFDLQYSAGPDFGVFIGITDRGTLPPKAKRVTFEQAMTINGARP